MRIAFPGHVNSPFTVSCIVMQFARESFEICRFRGSCVREYDLRPVYMELGNPR